MLSGKTKKDLTNAGWFEGRKIDVTKHIKVLKEEGYNINDMIIKFVEEYGELNVKYLDPEHNYREDDFYINPIKAVRGEMLEDVEWYEDYADGKLTVVGKHHNNEFSLLLSENGIMYIAMDEYFIRLGTNIEEGFIALCEAKGYQPIEIENAT